MSLSWEIAMQCDQMARLFLIFGHLQQWNFAQKHTKRYQINLSNAAKDF